MGFTINSSGTSYSLTPFSISAVITGKAPVALSEESTDTYLLVVDSGGSPDLKAYTFDTSDGSLTSPLSTSTGSDPTQPMAVTAAP
jgi:hypothetical protein